MTFKFYTYNRTGNDVIVSITAASETEAWVEFRETYGEVPVDFVRAV